MTDAVVRTTRGPIQLNLFAELAPKTVARFIAVATGTVPYSGDAVAADGGRRLYNGLPLYRVDAGFITHTALPPTRGDGYAAPPEAAEKPGRGFGAAYLAGLTRSTEFARLFITTAPTPWLNGHHALLGEVADARSRAVVDAIGHAGESILSVDLNRVDLDRVDPNRIDPNHFDEGATP
ncbi:peptidylprolyl isomerase [Sciscionella sediminilitoris]|uniref:peptidylprolyl isomerase n=1 Tax=Sciscionella sediminilitoris TaxID=1445613 RepID=UPI0004DFAFCC|nr:peptidylprolyl isomerase [Sciscionella sp. SE31]